MSFLSVGDVILCTQIAYRLLQSVTRGRKKAPHEIKELEDVLFGLYCSLEFLQRECEANTSRAIPTSSSLDNIKTRINMQLAYMVKSCLDTLRELDNATAKYRDIADPPPHTTILPTSTPPTPLLRLRAQLNTQWKRILWDLRGASYATKYRQRLQSHTDSINLFLSTMTWSATDRIGSNVEYHARRLDELVNQARQFSMAAQSPVQVSQPILPVEYAPNHHELASTSSIQQENHDTFLDNPRLILEIA